MLKKLVNKETKVVLVWGWPGIGKSTLIRNLSNYCMERNYFKEGAIYVNLAQVTKIEELLKSVLRSFQ